MPDIQPPNKGDNEEPLIPMPSVTPPPAPDAPSVNPPKLTSDNSSTPAVQTDEPPKEKPAPKIELKTESSEPKTSQSAPAKSASSADNSLDDIKKKALEELKPLLDEVDLPPEQMFHTLLEIISATNDKELIPKLYAAAEGIEDKHEKAQALIDVVSEIEYLNKDDEEN